MSARLSPSTSPPADLLGRRRRQTPEAPALYCVDDGRRLSYAELDDRARACAALLRALGLRPGDRCAVLADNRLELLDAFFAAGKSGVVFVPLNTRLAVPELAEILADCSPRLLLYGGAQARVAAALHARGLATRFVALDQPVAGPGDERYEELIAALDEGSFGEGAAADPAPCGPEDIYCLLYTSGTTGRPKGVMLPHRQVAFNADNTARGWGLAASDVTPVFVPLFHAGGLGALLAPMIAAGGTVVLHRSFDATQVLETIAAERCTVVLVVPTIAKLLLESPRFAEVDLSSLRWLISGGAPLPLELVTAYRDRGLVLKQGYGLTEVGPNCFAMTAEEAWRKRGTVGRPMADTEATLLDEGGHEVAGAGEVGELCLHGPHASLGYWRNTEATAAVFDERGFVHTGDLARRDEEGFFQIVGRRKEMFISGGENVYPAEVEAQLLQHPAVADAAVVGVADPRWGEVGAAFVVAAGDRSPRATELATFLDGRLARYKIPRRFLLVDALPRTAYGKVIRGELAARLAPGAGD